MSRKPASPANDWDDTVDGNDETYPAARDVSVTDDDENFDIPAPLPRKGPFAVEAVDPLVYRQTDDSPELRAAAAYIPVSSRIQVKDARPTLPRKKYFGKWTPGGNDEEDFLGENQGYMKEHSVPKPAKVFLAIIVSVIPIAIGWFLIVTALNFYQK